MLRRWFWLAALAVAGCATQEGGTDPAGYQLQLQQTAQEAALAPEPGSPGETEALERIKGYFGRMSPETVASMTTQVYAEDAWFNDTLKTLTGASEIQEYFTATLARSPDIQVEFVDVSRSGSEWYLRWQMTFSSPSLKDGEPLESIGMSHMRLNREGKILLHQDYWDSGSGLYAHLPVIGWSIGKVREQL